MNKYATFSLAELVFHMTTTKNKMLMLVDPTGFGDYIPVTRFFNNQKPDYDQVLSNWADSKMIIFDEVSGVIQQPTLNDIESKCRKYADDNPGIIETIVALYRQYESNADNRIRIRVYTKKGMNNDGVFYDNVCVDDRVCHPALVPMVNEEIPLKTSSLISMFKVIEIARFHDPDVIELVIDDVFCDDFTQVN
jgi:hypothetical protein